MTSGGRMDITASGGLYANPVPDTDGQGDFGLGKVRWDGTNNAAGNAHGGTYFGNPSPFVTVRDPQCDVTNRADTMGFNLFANGSCTLNAIADAQTGQVLLRNPAPGTRGNLGQNTIELPSSWTCRREPQQDAPDQRIGRREVLADPRGRAERIESSRTEQPDTEHQ